MVYVDQGDNSEIVKFMCTMHLYFYLRRVSFPQILKNTYLYTFFTVKVGMLLKCMRYFYVCILCVQRTVRGWQGDKVNHSDLGNARIEMV